MPSVGADLVVAAALGDEADDVVLARREPDARRRAGPDREGEAAGGDPPDRVDQLGERRGLEHEPGRAEPQRGLGVLRVVVGGQDDDRRRAVRAAGADVGQEPRPLSGPEPDVEQQDVDGARSVRPAARAASSEPRDADDLESRLRPEERGGPLARRPGGRR